MSENQSDDVNQDQPTGSAEHALPSQKELLEALQKENDELKAGIADAADARAERLAMAERLAQAEKDSDHLRQQFAELAVVHALDEAAVRAGVSPQSAAMYRSRFTCHLDADGRPKIEPDPAELLEGEIRSNPLLRESLERSRQDRQASAVTGGATEIGETDPVDLMAALDRNAARKAQFIHRHGAQAFIDLAEAARREGYRG